MDKKIIDIAKRYAEEVRRHFPAQMVILYGSHAKNKATPSSDIDIAVVMDELSADYLKISTELFHLVRTIDKRIEPALICRQYDRGGFLDHILKYGKIIYQASTSKAA